MWTGSRVSIGAEWQVSSGHLGQEQPSPHTPKAKVNVNVNVNVNASADISTPVQEPTAANATSDD